jgi:hypothetical protein
MTRSLGSHGRPPVVSAQSIFVQRPQQPGEPPGPPVGTTGRRLQARLQPRREEVRTHGVDQHVDRYALEPCAVDMRELAIAREQEDVRM